MPNLLEPIETTTLPAMGVQGHPEAIVAVCDQNTPEWEALRDGIVTASAAGRLFTDEGAVRKGQTPRSYLCELIAARVMRYRQIQPASRQLDRGHVLEPDARAMYALTVGRDVLQAGFVWRDAERLCGCSPDGLLPDRGLEIKCLMEKAMIDCLLTGVVPSEYIPQVQFSMWVTGLPRWDVCLYHPDPGIPLFVQTILADTGMHEAFARHVPVVMTEVAAGEKRIRERAGA